MVSLFQVLICADLVRKQVVAMKDFDYCKFTYAQSLKAFKEELSILYVGITRAKKNVFFTVNTGANKWNHSKPMSCQANLEGLILEDYEWENAI